MLFWKVLALAIALLSVIGFIYSQQLLEKIIVEEISNVGKPIQAESFEKESKILLKSRQFVPERGVSIEAVGVIKARAPKKTHVLIQFDKIPSIEEKARLEENGVKLLAFIPNNAWFAAILSENPEMIASLQNVRAIELVKPNDKIAPFIREQGIPDFAKNAEGSVGLTVLFFKDVSLQEAKELILKELDGNVVGEAPIINALVVFIKEEQLLRLASKEIVQWIEPIKPEPREFNDGLRAAINANAVQTTPYDLNGANIQVGEWDGGWVDATHDDLQGRVSIGDSGSSTGSHATHVAGTMLGDGSLSASKGGTALQWRGIATKAQVVSFEWWDNIAEMSSEFSTAINSYGIDLSTNSWGIGPSTITEANCKAILGNYFSESAAIDDIVQGAITKPIAIAWAAGNDRSTNPSYCGSIGFVYSTISPYGTSKNTITVGATNSNDDSITSFSSFGPTDDNRLKPEVVAPGCEVGGDAGIKSTIPTDNYAVYCGTSMATPAVAGSIALMLQQFRLLNNKDFLPSTVKALLAHTAKDLGNAGPDFQFGFGRIDIKSAIDLIKSDSDSNNVIVEDSLLNDKANDYTFSIPAGQTALKVTLAWDDYAGTPNSEKELVNDLDLELTSPSNSTYYPWVLNAASPSNAATTGIDNANNIEQVLVSTPEAGSWKLRVKGKSIPQAPQKYSLVSTNHLTPINYGYLQTYLISPSSDINVAKNQLFSFQAGVKCVGGYCGDVNAALDPTVELFYDDASAEGYLRYSSTAGGGLGVKFSPTEYPVKLKSVRFYLYNTRPFVLHVWDDDGLGETPKTDLLPAFQVTPSSSGWFSINLESYNLKIENGDFFVGWIEVSNNNSLGYDTSVPYNKRSWVYDKTSWASLADYSASYATYDLMVRATVETPKGIISMTPGTKPFYTVSANPKTPGNLACLNDLNDGEFCEQSWDVNATGDANQNFEFFVQYAAHLPLVDNNTTKKVKVTIVEVLEFVSISLVGFPLNFGSLNPDTNDNAALGNASNQYIVRVDNVTNVNIDLYQKGSDFAGSAGTIAVNNSSWNTTNNPATAVSMSNSYSLIQSSIPADSNVNLYYWLDIPAAKSAGNYDSNITIKAVKAGEMP